MAQPIGHNAGNRYPDQNRVSLLMNLFAMPGPKINSGD